MATALAFSLQIPFFIVIYIKKINKIIENLGSTLLLKAVLVIVMSCIPWSFR